ncbi:hypothetical protein LJ655_29095, partial [Paraburkholderia sp. MMS20-SJTN17]
SDTFCLAADSAESAAASRHQAPTLIGCWLLKIGSPTAQRLNYPAPRRLRRCVCSRETEL